MGPAASGRGLCDIDRVFSIVTKSRIKKLRSPGTAKIYRLCESQMILCQYACIFYFDNQYALIYCMGLLCIGVAMYRVAKSRVQ